MTTSAATVTKAGRWLQVSLYVGLLSGVAYLGWLASTRPFALDEWTYAHNAWQISVGERPYVDFFAHHTPGLWQLLAPVHQWTSSGPSFLATARWCMSAVWLSQLWTLWRLARPRVGPVWALVAPLLLLSMQVWADHVIELRPDGLAFALYLWVLCLLDAPPSHARCRRSRPTIAGAVIVLACWVSPKVAIYGAALAAMWVYDLATGGHDRAPGTLRPAEFLTGALAAVSALLGVLWASDSVAAFWRLCVQWPMRYESTYEGFPWWLWLMPSLRGLWGVVAASMMGAWSLRRRAQSAQGDPFAALWLATGPLALLTVMIQSAAYPYSFQPLWGWLALTACVGLHHLASRWRGAAWAPVLVSVAVWVPGAARAFDPSSRPPTSKRTAQLEVLAQVEQLTAATDTVYDNTGQAIRRPSPHYYGFTNHFVREHEGAMLTREIPRALLRSGTVVALVDSATGRLPPALDRFLKTYFLPWSGDIHLWGQAFPLRHGGYAKGTFVAPRRGLYGLEPMSSGHATTVWIDGRRYEGSTVRLDRGEHQVEVRGTTGAWILWLPRQGQRWRPDFDAQPRLRHVL